jgi:hypothetical protein
MKTNNDEKLNALVCQAFLFMLVVAAFPSAAHATETDVLDVILYWPFTIAVGLVINYTLKCLLIRLSGKMEFSRIITFEVIILFLAYAISGMLQKGWLMTILLYYPFAYLVNMVELNSREKQMDIRFELPSIVKMKFSALSSSTLLISVAIIKLMRLGFK